MPVKSYLAHPQIGQKRKLIAALSAIKECDVIPAENADVIVLVTDTSDKEAEEILKEKLDAIESLKLLAMVSGFNTPQNY